MKNVILSVCGFLEPLKLSIDHDVSVRLYPLITFDPPARKSKLYRQLTDVWTTSETHSTKEATS